MITQFFKQYWSGITTISIAVAAIVTATLSFESRYASAAEVAQLKQENKVVIEKVQQDNRKSIDRLRQQQLEDKIFELNLKGRSRTPVDEALLERYKQQHKDVTERLNNTR